MNGIDYGQLLRLAAPELILALGALAVLAIDLGIMRGEPLFQRRLIAASVTCLACAAPLMWIANIPQAGNLMHGMLVVDPLTRLAQQAILVLAGLTALLTVDSEFTDHVGEYFALILLATVGMMFLVSAEDILMIFVALELTSLSLYILAAFNKQSLPSAEAGLKYFLFGGMAAAFMLFGLSLVYGLTGATNLREIAAALKGTGLDPLLSVALVMTLIGFGFKVAVAPFHLWAPDAYQGAPTPSAAFIASGSKVASFVVLARVMITGFAGAEGSGSWMNYQPGWIPVLAALSVASVCLGNLAAIAQSEVKRLLAYSAIGHAGYALLGVMAGNGQGVSSLIYYVVTYALTTLGAFGVVAVVERATGGSKLTDFAGLSRRAPALSFCLMIFMLSLAGIPPLAGFFGKFYLFTAALGAIKDLGLIWLVILAIAMSAVSLFYYLQVLKQVYVISPPPNCAPIRTPIASAIALGLLAIAVIALGCAPDLILGPITEAVQASRW